MDQWFVARGKVKKGPYSRVQLQSAARKGTLRETDMLLHEGARTWIAACEVPGIFPSANAEPIVANLAVVPEPLTQSVAELAKAAESPITVPVTPASGKAMPVANFAQAREAPLAVPVASGSFAGAMRAWLWIGAGSIGVCMVVVVTLLLHMKPDQVNTSEVASTPKTSDSVLTDPKEPAPGKPSKDGALNNTEPSSDLKMSEKNMGQGVNAQSTSSLMESDVTLLKLASTRHYINGEQVNVSIDNYASHADLLAREGVKTGRTATLARLVLANYLVELKGAAVSSGRRDLVKKQLPAEIFSLSLRGALAGLRGEDIPPPFSAEFRDGPAKSGLNWVDRLRSNEIGKLSVAVLRFQANLNTAKVFEDDFGPRMGSVKMKWGAMDAKWLSYPSGEVRNFVEVKYEGPETLTNVVFVHRLKNAGLKTDLTEGQKRIMNVNDATGFGNKNEDIGQLFKLQNCVGSMPQGGVVYVPTVKPKDTVLMVIGTSFNESLGLTVATLSGLTVAMRCDQGWLPERKVEFKGFAGNTAAKAEAAPADNAPKNEIAEIAKLKQVLLSNTWHYHDSLFPPGENFRFNADGTWHQFKWNYWVVGPQSIRVNYDRNNRNKDTGVLFTFNPELTRFTGEFTEANGKCHMIIGTRN